MLSARDMLMSPVTFQDRWLALVLLDLIGSTRFVQAAGARRAAEWLQYHDRLTRSLIYRYQGREIDRSDGFLLSFERVIDAVNFGLAYQATIPQKTHLQCRIGIHWGRVVEVGQDELFAAVGAKSVELEGIAKNIAARTMSLCQAGQVLLTEDAIKHIGFRKNAHTPPSTRYACVGMYRFKGVREDVVIYAVGVSIESLQPPKGSEKAKRIGGPSKIKSRARERTIIEWVDWLLIRLSILTMICIIIVLWDDLIDENRRHYLGLGWLDWIMNPIGEIWVYVVESFKMIKEDLR